MRMMNPPHPGEILREDCIKALGLTVTEAAKALGVSRKTLSEIVNGKASITPDVAVRLTRAFRGPSADTWLRLQAQYDLRQAEKRLKNVRIKRVAMPKDFVEERI
jgi:addiction module HigA family antidote